MNWSLRQVLAPVHLSVFSANKNGWRQVSPEEQRDVNRLIRSATRLAADQLLQSPIYQRLATKSRLHLPVPKSFRSTHWTSGSRRRNGFSVAYEDSKPRPSVRRTTSHADRES